MALAPLIVSLFAPRPFGRLRVVPSAVDGRQARGARAFLLGFVAGLGYFGGTVYWTGTVVTQFGGLSWPVGVIVGALLVAYLALFPALFALCLGWLGARYGHRAMLLAPAVWVTTELGRTYFWSGFPWLLLGYSQTTVLPIAQFASVVGVFGMSALVALVSTALAYVVVSRSFGSAALVGVTAATLIAVTLWGNGRLEDGGLVREGRQVRVALIQGNIPQEQKWDDAFAGPILNTYLSLTREAAGKGAQLVIWPESSTPFPFLDDKIGGERIRALVRETGVELLLGSDQVDHRTKSHYNAAFLVRKDGTVAGVYQKMHLVPFGEFVPLQQLLFFVGPLVEQVGGFTAGRDMVILPTAHGPISTAICYEIVFPRLVRESVLREQSASDDNHQRCVVRSLVGAVSAFPAGVDARDRAGPLSRARSQYGHHGNRRSVRTRGAENRDFRARRGCRRRAPTRGAHDLWENRRSVRIHSRGADARRAAFRPSAGARGCPERRRGTQEAFVAIALDDLNRRYQDLVKRAADLRSYL